MSVPTVPPDALQLVAATREHGSIEAAAAALGVPLRTAFRMLARLKAKQPTRPPTGRRRKAVTAADIEATRAACGSIDEAARLLGISRTSAFERLRRARDAGSSAE